MELLINSNSNSWEILLTIAIAIAIVPKMSIAIVISILLISSDSYLTKCTDFKYVLIEHTFNRKNRPLCVVF